VKKIVSILRFKVGYLLKPPGLLDGIFAFCIPKIHIWVHCCYLVCIFYDHLVQFIWYIFPFWYVEKSSNPEASEQKIFLKIGPRLDRENQGVDVGM
jgi:hypothetical protein